MLVVSFRFYNVKTKIVSLVSNIRSLSWLSILLLISHPCEEAEKFFKIFFSPSKFIPKSAQLLFRECVRLRFYSHTINSEIIDSKLSTFLADFWDLIQQVTHIFWPKFFDDKKQLKIILDKKYWNSEFVFDTSLLSPKNVLNINYFGSEKYRTECFLTPNFFLQLGLGLS